MEALVPADDVPAAQHLQPEELAQRIYELNVEKLQRADGVIANLQPFRGIEPDSGTVFEVGFAIALQLPVVGYGVPAETYGARVQAALPCSRDAAGVLRDQVDQLAVEEFGQQLNLMLSRSITIEKSAEAALELLALRFAGRAPRSTWPARAQNDLSSTD
jgi:nucleoside 2-deoxyribosyltransferase